MMPIVMVMITMMMMMVMTMVMTCDHSPHLNTQWVETKFSLFAFHLIPKSFREIKTLYFYKILKGTWECKRNKSKNNSGLKVPAHRRMGQPNSKFDIEFLTKFVLFILSVHSF